jgi:hypothetical protein
MQEIIEYTTAFQILPSELDKRVNDLIADGWQPFGVPYVGKPGYLMQAMVKYKKD